METKPPAGFQSWLKTQPEHVQDETLGKKDAEKFRAGSLTLDRFTDKTGKRYSLNDLQDLDARMFAESV